jgi:hypothetical protein
LISKTTALFSIPFVALDEDDDDDDIVESEAFVVVVADELFVVAPIKVGVVLLFFRAFI